ncbi:MAG TPA: DUF805 domain-containing protein [Armatimonadota bacterium]|jgi:uncharacterized membrane protein YhaH (DUF805 family)
MAASSKRLGVFRPGFKPFSIAGRINRAEFAGCIAAFYALYVAAYAPCLILFHPQWNHGRDIFSVSISCVLAAWLVMQAVKRMHDLDWPGEYALGCLVPAGVLIFVPVLLLLPGTPGTNRFDVKSAPEGMSDEDTP